MEGKERRNKLGQRSWQGTHAWHDDETDTTTYSLGWMSDGDQSVRAMSYCQARCIQLNISYAYNNALTIERKWPRIH